MARHLDLALLRAFTVVAEQKSMTAAGRLLHLTQGAVSQQIARLEGLTGGPVFARDRRGLSLTAAGERLLGKARRILALNDEIWIDINGGAIDGMVRLGVAHDLVGTCLAPVLTSYSTACPRVELSLSCGTSLDLSTALAAGHLDAAVLEQAMGQETGECLMVDRLVWAGARGGTAYAKTPLPVSIVAETCVFRPAVLAALHGQGRRWRTVFENGGLDATLATVRTDLAISAWLASTVPADLDLLTPDTGLPDLPSFAITLHLPDRPSPPAARELARHIREGLTRSPAARPT